MKTPLATLCILVAALAGPETLHAAELVWDADTAASGGQDGSGNWNALASNTNWWTGSLNVTWNNATPDSALFGANSGAAAGTVTVPSNTTNSVANISFGPATTGSYVVAAGSATTSKLNLSGNPTITVSNGVSAAINVVFTGGAFVKTGGGTLTNNPGAPNLNTGTTLVSGGTLVVGGAASNRRIIPGDLIVTNIGSTVRLGAAENITNSAIAVLNPGTTFDMNGKGQTLAMLALNGGTVRQSGTETLTVTGVIDAGGGTVLSTDGKIDADTFLKSSGGTVVLQSKGSVKEAGLTNTILEGGILILDYGPQNSSKLSDNGSLDIIGGILILTNGSHAEAVAAMTLVTGFVTNAAGTVRFTMPAGNYDVQNGAVYAVLSGAAGLSKTTPGKVVLAAANTYSGGTLISNGVLQLGDGHVTGSVSGAITNNAVLLLDPASPLSLSSTISGTGSVIKTGNGTALLTAINSHQGATTISNGILSVDSDATLGDGLNTLRLSGGTLNATANRSPGSAPISNPILLTADSAITTTSTSTSSDVDLNLTSDSVGGTAGTLTFSNANGSAASVFAPRFSGEGFTFGRPLTIANGGVIGATRLNSFNTTGTTQIFSGPISGSGSYRRTASTVSSGGVTIFAANNTYSGSTEVNRGTLLVNGSLAAASTVTVGGLSQDGTLGGNGIINGPVSVLTSGTLSPGTSIGCLTISNNLTFLPGSTVLIELNKSQFTNDAIRGVATLNYGGTLVVTNLSGILTQNDTFKLFHAASYSGAFDAIELPALGAGLNWDTSALTNTGTIKVTGTAPPQMGTISIAASPAGVVITGNGGIAGADYYVLTSSNLALPRSSWTPIATNQFGAGGNLSFTNSINPFLPKVFYIIQAP